MFSIYACVIEKDGRSGLFRTVKMELSIAEGDVTALLSESYRKVQPF
jgi:hypothetical protein